MGGVGSSEESNITILVATLENHQFALCVCIKCGYLSRCLNKPLFYIGGYLTDITEKHTINREQYNIIWYESRTKTKDK